MLTPLEQAMLHYHLDAEAVEDLLSLPPALGTAIVGESFLGFLPTTFYAAEDARGVKAAQRCLPLLAEGMEHQITTLRTFAQERGEVATHAQGQRHLRNLLLEGDALAKALYFHRGQEEHIIALMTLCQDLSPRRHGFHLREEPLEEVFLNLLEVR